jgi:hypothetical protein
MLKEIKGGVGEKCRYMAGRGDLLHLSLSISLSLSLSLSHIPFFLSDMKIEVN